MSDARKKLEELRKKNAEAKAKLNSGGATSTTITNASNSVTGSSTGTSTNSAIPVNSVDQLIKQVTKAPADINIEEIRKATMKMGRYSSDGLSYSYLSDSIIGKAPEMYEEGVQCEFENSKSDSEEEEDEYENKRAKGAGYRKSVMMSFGKKTPFAQVSSKKSDISTAFVIEEKTNEKSEGKVEGGSSAIKNKNIVNEEMRRQILNSHELNEFLSTKSKYVERVNLIF